MREDKQIHPSSIISLREGFHEISDLSMPSFENGSINLTKESTYSEKEVTTINLDNERPTFVLMMISFW